MCKQREHDSEAIMGPDTQPVHHSVPWDMTVTGQGKKFE